MKENKCCYLLDGIYCKANTSMDANYSQFCRECPSCYYKQSVLFRDCLLDIYNYKLSKHDIAKKIEECFSKFQELQKLVKKKLRIVKGGK